MTSVAQIQSNSFKSLSSFLQKFQQTTHFDVVHPQLGLHLRLRRPFFGLSLFLRSQLKTLSELVLRLTPLAFVLAVIMSYLRPCQHAFLPLLFNSLYLVVKAAGVCEWLNFDL